jgi:hypothetical protein
MERQLLTDPDAFPTAEVLEGELGRLYSVLKALMQTVESEDFGLTPEWRFYQDGKAWLCKVVVKKKTVAWLSVWSNCIKLAFYFTEKSGEGVPDLDIQDALKEQYRTREPVGKLKPLVVELSRKGQLRDASTILRYKISTL